MWLPRDERCLLAGYYWNIGEVDQTAAHKMTAVIRLLRWRWRPPSVPEYGEGDLPDDQVH